jgi:glycosyltransferase involved in cell wall biosynthesis
MKILYIITRIDHGGSAEHVARAAQDLLARGTYDIHLISGKAPMTDSMIVQDIQRLGIRYLVIPELVRLIHPWKDAIAFLKLFRHMRCQKFDIVHTHTSKAGMLGRWAAWAAGVPVIIHTPHGHVFYGYYGRWISAFFVAIERLAGLITTRLIMLTAGEQADTVSRHIIARHKCVIIPCGVEIKEFREKKIDLHAVRRQAGFSDTDHIVGTVTRLEKVKGNRYLINAWQEVSQSYPRAKLLIVGNGSERSFLESLAENLGIRSSIVFAGFRNDIAELISILDFFVLPSINEGMGKVLIQAAVLGKPSVGSDICGIPDVIKHEETGLLVPPADSRSLAQAIMRLLGDPEMRARYGAQARQWVTGSVDGHPRFSNEAMAAKLDALYKNLLSAFPRAS